MFPNFSGSIIGMAEDHMERLGKLVQARRIEQGWPTRERFAKEVGLSSRVLADLENGNRRLGKASNYQVEIALQWVPGSIDAVLDGGDPTLITPELLDEKMTDAIEQGRRYRPSRYEDPSIKQTVEILRLTKADLDDAAAALEADDLRQAHNLLSRANVVLLATQADIHHKIVRADAQQEEDHDVDTTPPAGASSEANQDEKTDSSVDNSKDWRLNEAARDAAGRMGEASKEQREVQ